MTKAWKVGLAVAGAGLGGFLLLKLAGGTKTAANVRKAAPSSGSEISSIITAGANALPKIQGLFSGGGTTNVSDPVPGTDLGDDNFVGLSFDD